MLEELQTKKGSTNESNPFYTNQLWEESLYELKIFSVQLIQYPLTIILTFLALC
jgi:hypothetical protein